MAKIMLVNGKWHCYGPDGKDWCAYNRRDWAEECAKSHGFKTA